MIAYNYYCKKTMYLGGKIAYQEVRVYSDVYFDNDWGVSMKAEDDSGLANSYNFSHNEYKTHMLYLYDYFLTVKEARNEKIKDLLCQ